MPRHLSRYRFAFGPTGRIAYREAGSGTGSPVLMIHGMASRAATWDAVAGKVSASGKRVIAIDLRGHGRSVHTRRYPMNDFVDDTVVLLDALDVPRLDVIGHSLGGHIALRLAQRQPDRIRRLVLEDVPVPPRDASDTVVARSSLRTMRLIRTLGLGPAIAIALWRRFDLRMARPILAELRAPMPEWWRDLERIEARTLLLAANRSHIPVEASRKLSEAIPHAIFRVLEGGHRLHSQNLTAFLAEVLPFLDA